MKFKIMEFVNIGQNKKERKHAVQCVLKKTLARSLKQKIRKKMVKSELKMYLKELLEL